MKIPQRVNGAQIPKEILEATKKAPTPPAMPTYKRQIRKYELNISGETNIKLITPCKVLAVDIVDNKPYAWIEVCTDDVEKEPARIVAAVFSIKATGDVIADPLWRHLHTFFQKENVWHAYVKV